MILRSAGFVTSDMIGAQNNVNFAYILYLRGRAENLPAAELERLVRRWYALSVAHSPLLEGEPGDRHRLRHPPDRGIRGLSPFAPRSSHPSCPRHSGSNLVPIELDTVIGQQPVFPRLQGRPGEARRQGFSLAGHHRSRFADEPQRCASRLSEETPEDARPHRAAATTRSPTSCLLKAKSTSPSATNHPRSTSRNWPSNATVVRARYGGITRKAEMRANFRMTLPARVVA